ncbi:hypothetical protein BJ165DRAFT_1346288, partial [Panaeolus papilionaceus]
NFIPKLRNHLLSHFSETTTVQNFTETELNSLRIQNNVIYGHSTARINYTTYDMRRDFDTINPRSHPFIMTVSPESVGRNTTLSSASGLPHTSASVFWYAAVLGIFHADVQRIGTNSGDLRHRTYHFLWVRWLEPVPGHLSGRRHSNLPKLRCLAEEDEFAYGFLDPALVLRGCHLIPAFCDGLTSGPLDQTISYRGCPVMSTAVLQQWKHYCVGM